MPIIDAMRSVLRHPTLDAAFKELVLTLPSRDLHRRAARRGRPAAHPRRARSHARAARHGAASPTGSGPTKRTSDTGAYTPDPVSSGRRALAGMALAHPVPGGARHAATRSGPARRYQRFKDAGNMTDRFNALTALVSSGHALAAQALARFHAHVQGRGAGASTSGSRCRPARPTAAATCCRRCKQLMKHPDFIAARTRTARAA